MPRNDTRSLGKILLSPTEMAGQVGLEVCALRSLGYQAYSMFSNHQFRYPPPDYLVRGSSILVQRLDMLLKAIMVAPGFDVFHFFYGSSLLPKLFRQLDARVFRRLGRRVIVEFCGSEARLPGVESARNPYYVNAYGESDSSRRRMARWAEITGGHVILHDAGHMPYVGEYFQSIHTVPLSVNIPEMTPVFPEPEAHIPRLVHAPSNSLVKGTMFVRRTVEELRDKGLLFDYVELQNASHDDVLKQLATADLVIDQLCLGAYGVLAVEAMALGKPVVCYIGDWMQGSFPTQFPVISANPDILTDVVGEWLMDFPRLKEQGILSRTYAEQVHNVHTNVLKLVEIYQNLPRR